MALKTLLLAILVLAPFVLSLSITKKTIESTTKSFNKYDENEDDILSKKQARKYFDEEYMKDFEGIDIDPKFIESSFTYILNSDKDKNGLDLEEFQDAIIPKQETNKKTEPQYYPQQEL